MRLSISNRIGLVVLAVLSVTLTIMLVTLIHYKQKDTVASAERQVREATEIMVGALKYTMSQGSSDIGPLVANMSKTGDNREVRLIPTEAVHKGSEAQMDEAERASLISRQQAQFPERFKDEPVVRGIVPIMAEESCTSCHQVKVGDPLAVVSLRYSVADAYQANAAFTKLAIILALIILAGTVTVIYWLINRQVITPILKCVNFTEQLSQGDLSGEVQVKSLDETGHLAQSLNTMTQALRAKAQAAEKIANGDLTVEITAASEQDVLSRAMIRMRENIAALVEDAKKLAQASLAGKLKTRAEADRHQGEYRRIIEGFNQTLDAIIQPVQEAAGVLEEMAKGNLNVAVRGEYQGDHAVIKNALNDTLAALNDLLAQVSVAVDQVASGSQQVSNSAQALSQGATEQASSLEEVSASMTEMASQTKANAENSAQASDLATASMATAEEGDIRMQQMLGAMSQINDSSGQISKIIKVIDEIAFQTNLLALNAAVEAARAGVHGKGFAVVAEEVRNLAQRSAKAAKETTELIEGSVQKVENGTAIAQQTAQALNQIVTQISKVKNLVAEIASASGEQAQGIEQTNEALGHIDEVTQANTASAEESASAAEELSSQANYLRDMLSRFKLRRQKQEREIPDHVERMVRDLTRPASPGRKSRPAEIIALDDEEFGKY